MTRTFRANIYCPHCGRLHTVESAFERWMRHHPDLDSREAGVVRFDCDVLLHRYALHTDKKSSRHIQCLMFVEVKTCGAVLDLAQQDTFSLLSQVLRNRRPNRHHSKRGRHAENHVPLAEVWSHFRRGMVRLRMFGVHLLRLSGQCPLTSEWMEWDSKRISLDQLIALLRFELDPDKLEPIDWRRRYSDFVGPPSMFDQLNP